MVCLSVCLSSSCTVLKLQKISAWFLLHTTAPCPCQIVLKCDLHPSIPSSQNICPKVTHPCLLECRRHSFNSKLRPNGQSQRHRDDDNSEPIGNHRLFFRIEPSLTPYDPLLPQLGPQMHRPWASLHLVLPPGEYYRRAMSPFAKLLWPMSSLRLKTWKAVLKLSQSNFYYQLTCLSCVCVLTTLMQHISETKRLRGSCPIGTLEESAYGALIGVVVDDVT